MTFSECVSDVKGLASCRLDQDAAAGGSRVNNEPCNARLLCHLASR